MAQPRSLLAGSDGRAHQKAVKLGIRNGDDVQVWMVSTKTTKLCRTALTAFRTRRKLRSRRPKLPRKEKTGSRLPAMQRPPPGDRMTSNTVGVRENSTATDPRPYWVAQHSRPVIFLILTLGLLGALSRLHHPSLCISPNQLPASLDWR